MYRKGVSALIINSKDEILLVNLTSFEERYFAVPGGGVSVGETLHEAVYREIHEELGITKESLEFIGTSNTPIKFKFKVITLSRDGKEYEGSERYFFGFRLINDDIKIETKDGEVRMYKWVSFDELKDYLLFDNQLQETTKKMGEIFPSVSKGYAQKPTLLFVEEFETTLSREVISRQDIKVVLLRFKQNMLFSNKHLEDTITIPCFIFDKEKKVEEEVKSFNEFCAKNNICISHFYNDSEYNQEKIQKFASLLNIPGALDDHQAILVRDKAAMKDKLREIGYRTMPYSELSSNNDVFEFAKQHGGFPTIVKWRRGLSSIEVYKIENRKYLEDLNLDYSSNRYIVEEYCPYKIWCIDALVQEGEVMGTFLTWLPYTNLSFAETKEKFAQITVDKHPSEIDFDEKELAQNIISAIGLQNGYFHLEVFVDTKGLPIICEYAWRTSGERMLANHSKAFDINIYSLIVDIMVGKSIKGLKLVGKRCVGDMSLPLRSGIVVQISSADEFKEMEGVVDGKVLYKIGDIIESKRKYTDCSGWLQITGETKDRVLEKMLSIYDKFLLKVQPRD